MENKASYSKHFYLLALLFVLGNACVTAPVKSADKYNFFTFLISCIIGALLAFLGYLLPVNRFTALPVFLLCFYTFGDCFITFVRFISDNLLPYTSKVLIVIPFILVMVYLGFKKSDTLFKFSLICGFLTMFVVIFFFFSTLKDFNFKNIYITRLPSIKNLFSQIGFYIKTLVLPSFLLGIFAKEEKIKKSTLLGGLSLGFLCLAITILNSVLLFSVEFSGALEYPYSAAGSTVTFGNLFTRLDGFLYFVYSATAIVKCAVGIFTVKKTVSALKNRFLP